MSCNGLAQLLQSDNTRQCKLMDCKCDILTHMFVVS